MATFVLVHGAWHGGWCWNRVIPLLETAGHRAFGPSLTGLGERADLLSPEVGLSRTFEISSDSFRSSAYARSSWSGTATAAW